MQRGFFALAVLAAVIISLAVTVNVPPCDIWVGSGRAVGEDNALFIGYFKPLHNLLLSRHDFRSYIIFVNGTSTCIAKIDKKMFIAARIIVTCKPCYPTMPR